MTNNVQTPGGNTTTAGAVEMARRIWSETTDSTDPISAIARAITETTERAAAVVKEYAAEAQDSYHRCLGNNAAEAIECGDHLKGPKP